ncbi:DUF3306 domain-containing protein [Mesobacterium pallidum]|uniref:DUF3306 domain-containing protein n=1 Tax=Mesobacterium pallidum TaxID=2872037 RepID=UPI001EE36AEC|nr:DUF3306 domain-containing protein [Mesobacterium pallidum]
MSRLSAWTARKAAVAKEAQAEEAARREAEEAEARALQEARPDDELLAEAGLPDPDRVDSAEMIQAFLRSEVPQRLKNRALRSMWRSNPVLACVDGLNDYDDDYTTAAEMGDAVRTSYVVGKGIFHDLQQMVEGLGETEGAAEVAASDEPVEVAGDTPDAIADPEPQPVLAATDAPDPIPAASRRMRFRFDT